MHCKGFLVSMKFSISFLLVLIFHLSFGQDNSKEVQSILEKLEKLEEIKESNDSVQSMDLISDSNFMITLDSSGHAVRANEPLITAFEVDDTTKTKHPIIHFDTLTFNVGSITQGELVEKKFSFKNIGSEDLERPGMSGYIIATYDSHDDIGKFLKTITVLHNAGEGFTFLEISGFVSPKL